VRIRKVKISPASSITAGQEGIRHLKTKYIRMKDKEIGELEILVNKLKFKAGQKASDLHDLIEDRLMTDFEDIPAYAEIAFAACKEWSNKNQELLAAKQKP
jgi:hypothetical protein